MSDQVNYNLASLRRSLQRMIGDEKDRPPPRGAENRRHERHFYMIDIQAKYVKQFQGMDDRPGRFAAITKDLSRSGLSFVYEHQMYAGEIVEVEMVIGGVRKTMLMKIARCRRAGLRVFDIAGQFLTPEEAAKEQAKPTLTAAEAAAADAEEAAAEDSATPAPAESEDPKSGG